MIREREGKTGEKSDGISRIRECTGSEKLDMKMKRKPGTIGSGDRSTI